MTRQREQLKEKLGKIHIKNKTCIDWGSGAKPAARYIGTNKNNDWSCLDKNESLTQNYREWGLSYLLVDIETMNMPMVFDVAFCLEVLEHTPHPQKVIDKIHSCLRSVDIVTHLPLSEPATLYLSVPFLYPIHSDEDYWRFTEHGLRHLLRSFSDVKIESFEDESGYWVEAIK